jgi:hypothetical protein
MNPPGETSVAGRPSKRNCSHKRTERPPSAVLEYLTNGYRRLGYHATNVVFAYLPIVYVIAASQPRWIE